MSRYGRERDGGAPSGGSDQGGERRSYGGGDQGGERRSYGGDRGGDQGGERRSYGGDRGGSYGGDRGGSSGGYGGDRGGDRDGFRSQSGGRRQDARFDPGFGPSDRGGDRRGSGGSGGFGSGSQDARSGSGYPGLNRLARGPTPEELARQEAAREAEKRRREEAAAEKEKAKQEAARKDLERRLVRPYVPEAKEVVVEASALMKISRHVHASHPDAAMGQILGHITADGKLVITSVFAVPAREVALTADPKKQSASAQFQRDMIKGLRKVNDMDEPVGWYTSTVNASFLTSSAVENLFKHQTTPSVAPAVMLVYDAHKAASGVGALKALRFSPDFVKEYEQNRQALSLDLDVSLDRVFVNLPVQVHTNALAAALIHDLNDQGKIVSSDGVLDMTLSPFAQASLDFLGNVADEFVGEQTKLQHHVRNSQRQKAAQAVWVSRREAENVARRERGEEPLSIVGTPADDACFKTLQAPKRLDPLILSVQMSLTVEELESHVANGVARLHLLKSVQA